LRAVKWKDWKLHLVWEPEVNDGPIKLESPYLFNLIQDPKEETDIHTANSWVSSYMRRMLLDFQKSLQDFPPVPPGARDPYTPPKRP